MKRSVLLTLAAAVIGIGADRVLFPAIAAVPELSCHGSARAMARLEMIFGTTRPHGAPVTDEEWTMFLASEVTPRFPQGLTVLRGPGQWRESNGRLMKEQSAILVIWHEPTVRANADIEAIRSAYKQRFEQESVMRVDSLSCVSF